MFVSSWAGILWTGAAAWAIRAHRRSNPPTTREGIPEFSMDAKGQVRLGEGCGLAAGEVALDIGGSDLKLLWAQPEGVGHLYRCPSTAIAAVCAWLTGQKGATVARVTVYTPTI